MKTVSYFLSWADTSICAVDRIANDFPCFVTIADLGEDDYEVMISARAEDIASIEKILAPFV